MKVLTLTTQYANNMGALLQCYALSKFLNTQDGIECEVIDYLPDNHKASWTGFYKPKSFRDLIKMIYIFLRFDQIIIRNRKNRKVRNFISKYIPLTRKKYNRKKIVSYPPKADAYICGSDQIWNFHIFNGDTTYFLDFISGTKKKKIAYAASLTQTWEDKQGEMVRPLLNQFDSISIREGVHRDLVKRISGKDVQVVLDPVFLLTRSEWFDMTRPITIDEPYIFCYFLSVPENAVKIVKRLRKITGYKVIYLNLNALDKFNSDKIIRDADPIDFLSLIANASYVCTNSFHCTAFSLIFKRNIRCIAGARDSRMRNLQEIFQLNSLFIEDDRLDIFTKEEFYVDYTSEDLSSSTVVKKSKQFIIQALNEKKN